MALPPLSRSWLARSPPSPFLAAAEARTLSAPPPSMEHAPGPSHLHRSASSSLHTSSTANEPAWSESETYDYATQVDDNLICSICRNPFFDPVACDSGDHLFCKLCIMQALEHSPTCPIDRGPLSVALLTSAPRIVMTMLSELLVHCPHRSRGCEHTCQRQFLPKHFKEECPWASGERCKAGCGKRIRRGSGEIEKHLKECPERKETCLACGDLVRTADLKNHSETCSGAQIQCTDCSVTLLRSGLAAHMLSCPLRPIPCPHSHFGCAMTMPRHLLHSHHIPSCPYESIKGFLEQYSEKMDGLETENRLLRRKVDELERCVEDMEASVNGCKASLGPYYYSSIFPFGTPTITSVQDPLLDEEGTPISQLRSSPAQMGDLDTPSNILFHEATDWRRRIAGSRPTAASPPPAMRSNQPDLDLLERMAEGDSGRTSVADPRVYSSLMSRRSLPNPLSPEGWRYGRDAFPDSYTPASAFPSLRMVPSDDHSAPSSSHHQLSGERDGHRVHASSNLALSQTRSAAVRRRHEPSLSLQLNHPGTLTATLHSLASSLATMSRHVTLMEERGRVADIAFDEASRAGEELAALRGMFQGMRMQMSVLMMERRVGASVVPPIPANAPSSSSTSTHPHPHSHSRSTLGGGPPPAPEVSSSSVSSSNSLGSGPPSSTNAQGDTDPLHIPDDEFRLFSSSRGHPHTSGRWGSPHPHHPPPTIMPNSLPSVPPPPHHPFHPVGMGMGFPASSSLYGGLPTPSYPVAGPSHLGYNVNLYRRSLGQRGDIKL